MSGSRGRVVFQSVKVAVSHRCSEPCSLCCDLSCCQSLCLQCVWALCIASVLYLACGHSIAPNSSITLGWACSPNTWLLDKCLLVDGWDLRTGGPSHTICFLLGLHLLLGFRSQDSTSTDSPQTDPPSPVSLSWGKSSRLWSLSLFFFGFSAEQKVVYVCSLFSSWVSRVCLRRCRQAGFERQLSHVLLGAAAQRSRRCWEPTTD